MNNDNTFFSVHLEWGGGGGGNYVEQLPLIVFYIVVAKEREDTDYV
jgi:hypothetical protein